ncbi:hypothetical protein DVH24_022520 [Malus domestica]|uniref:Bromo domain-containing protein n=1 Tax=Malus domestica TaxID=3750 RepID=A0A498KLM4_MALDO|nr:hypothetical protein DVH24_022520 [Malus domestica]
MDRDLLSLRDTFATLQSLLEAPAGAEQIDLNVPRETNGPIFDTPFYIGDSGSSCLSSNFSLHDTMGDLLSAEGREAHMCGRKRRKNVGNFMDKLSCDLGERQMPVQHDSRRDYQQSGKRLLYREGGQNDGVIPNPLSLNSALGNVTGAATGAATVAVEYSAERSVLNTNRPASSGARMSYTIQTKCQEALNMIKRLIDEKGHEIMPFSLSAWRQIVSSAHRMNVSGTDILNFQKIYQRLDQRDYYGVLDFAADVQLTFKCLADQYPLYSPIRDEVQKVEVLFFDIMKRMFPDTDFQQLQNQVQNLA